MAGGIPVYGIFNKCSELWSWLCSGRNSARARQGKMKLRACQDLAADCPLCFQKLEPCICRSGMWGCETKEGTWLCSLMQASDAWPSGMIGCHSDGRRYLNGNKTVLRWRDRRSAMTIAMATAIAMEIPNIHNLRPSAGS